MPKSTNQVKLRSKETPKIPQKKELLKVAIIQPPQSSYLLQNWDLINPNANKHYNIKKK